MDWNQRLQAANRRIAAMKIARRDAVLLVRAAEQALSEAAAAEQAMSDAAEIVAKLAEARAAASVAAFERTASQCLQAIFGAGHSAVLTQTSTAGKSQIKIEVRIDGELLDPLTSCGGGVVDVLCFGLRLASLVYDVTRPRMLLILDEPFRFVSREYRPRIAAMLESLASSCGVQIIMVTHQPELEVGVVVRLGNSHAIEVEASEREEAAV